MQKIQHNFKNVYCKPVWCPMMQLNCDECEHFNESCIVKCSLNDTIGKDYHITKKNGNYLQVYSPQKSLQ
jgi:hypothetical protein